MEFGRVAGPPQYFPVVHLLLFGQAERYERREWRERTSQTTNRPILPVLCVWSSSFVFGCKSILCQPSIPQSSPSFHSRSLLVKSTEAPPSFLRELSILCSSTFPAPISHSLTERGIVSDRPIAINPSTHPHPFNPLQLQFVQTKPRTRRRPLAKCVFVCCCSK
jgi:hypothetical protein